MSSSPTKGIPISLATSWSLFSRLVLLSILIAVNLFASGQNAIALENALPGNPSTEWQITGVGDLALQGFATEISINKGERVRFKIKADVPGYTMDIYRLGYYGGMGARKLGTGVITGGMPQNQPGAITNVSTGLVDCGNWAESGYWDVPSNAVSGVYIAKLTRTDTASASHIVFIVRDDASSSDLLFQTSDATWHAYNTYGGYSFYGGATSYPSGRAVKISYNRPFLTRGSYAGDFLFNAEYPMIRFLERNGYDVSYMASVDTDRRGSLIQNHKVFLSVGHDEYWSASQRNNVTTARNAGVHLAFFSGNEVYWKTRWENSVDGTNTPYRTLVCYKEGTVGENVCRTKCDPVAAEWTGLWREGCNYPAANGCNPEQNLTGQIGWTESSTGMQVPFALKNLRFWRHTDIPSLLSGQVASFTNQTVGYEWDHEQSTRVYPVGRVKVSRTTLSSRTHNMSFFKHTNGAIVFGAGTVQYSWGLDSVHDRASEAPDKRMQQATVNLFADMGSQPSTIQSDLILATASTDVTPPASVFTSPLQNGLVIQGTAITIRGSSSDVGGVVYGIEVSTDNGLTWRAANNTNSWTISWTPTTLGTNVLKVRGLDDSGNLEGPTSTNTITVNVLPAGNPIEGPGGPILLVSNPANPFSRFSMEIMRAQGFNEWTAMDVAQISSTIISNYDVIVLGETPLTAAQVTMFTNYVNSGGTLVAFRPAAVLAPLLGLTPVGDSLLNRYLLVNTAGGPGAGIVGETIQYHSAADLYNLNGATALATIYSNANTPTVYPAVTTMSVGSNGGQAIAFTYDLARSIVYTRQGNPAWAGTDRDGLAPVRSNDMFFGGSEPDWIDLNKVAIPQADEQIHLLANIIQLGNADKKPLPRFWFLPRGFKAAIIMTGDDHANGGTIARFNQYYSLSPSNSSTAVNDWDAIRGTSYIYTNTPMTNAQVVDFQNKGFEIALHLNTTCSDFTASSLQADLANQRAALVAAFPNVATLRTNRTHCIVWSDWSTKASVQAAAGIRLDVNYYYWPGSWVQNRAGMFTGSGFPMRFAALNGSIIDCYQVPTQLSDEANLDYGTYTSALLNKAVGPEGFYGVFCANMHTDENTSVGSDAIIASAKEHGVPVISAKQMLTWLDGRNNSYFTDMSWNGNALSFGVIAATGSRNIETMLPMNFGALRLATITTGSTNVSFRKETIKGIQYAFFRVATANYVASYIEVPPCVTPTAVISSPAAICPGQQVTLSLASATGTPPYSLTVNGVTYNNVLVGQTIATMSFAESSLWSNTTTPVLPAVTDNTPIETGVRFKPTVNGQITGIRFYKGAGNSGVHIGNLYQADGTLLATATFVNETATGWQTVRFGSPVNVTAGETYIATNHSAAGYYAYSGGYFSSGGVTNTNGQLIALQHNVEGPNGVFRYGGGFPTDGNGANYWVDVLFKISTASPTIDFVLTGITDNNGCSNSGTISTTSSTLAILPAGTIASGGPVCKGNPIMLTFNSTIGTNPFTIKVNNTTYNNVTSGVPFNSGVIADAVSHSFYTNTTTPGANSLDPGGVEVGHRFRTSIGGSIKSVKFYKYAQNTGTHTANLWTATGTLLATATFINETASGWQQVDFATPVPITANTTYVVSYHTPTGYYAYTYDAFNNSQTNGPITWIGGSNGLYNYGASSFPTNVYRNNNYWIDVVFETNGAQAFTLNSVTDGNLCTRSGNLGSIIITPQQCDSSSVTRTNISQPMISEAADGVKAGYSLEQNYPNPTDNKTTIRYTLGELSHVRIVLYDGSGRLVRILVNETKMKGSHSVEVNTAGLGKGMYYYRMDAGGFSAVKKLTIQ
jgi:hypothetical protein